MAHHPSSVQQSAFADNMFRAGAVAHTRHRSSPQHSTRCVSFLLNPQRLRELCQMKATGVMPDNMSCAADVVAEKMKEHCVELVQKVKSFSTVLEEEQAHTWHTQFGIS